jgi:hypothetical protein
VAEYASRLDTGKGIVAVADYFRKVATAAAASNDPEAVSAAWEVFGVQLLQGFSEDLVRACKILVPITVRFSKTGRLSNPALEPVRKILKARNQAQKILDNASERGHGSETSDERNES